MATTHLAPISVTALTEDDVDLMERIEAALCRWVRVSTFHPSQEDRILATVNDALLLMEEYGPDALLAAPRPGADAHAETWETVRELAARAALLHSIRPGRPTRVRSVALATHHTSRAHEAFRNGEHNIALTWLDAAEQVDPRLDPYWDEATGVDPDFYDRLRAAVAEGAALLAA